MDDAFRQPYQNGIAEALSGLRADIHGMRVEQREGMDKITRLLEEVAVAKTEHANLRREFNGFRSAMESEIEKHRETDIGMHSLIDTELASLRGARKVIAGILVAMAGFVGTAYWRVSDTMDTMRTHIASDRIKSAEDVRDAIRTAVDIVRQAGMYPPK